MARYLFRLTSRLLEAADRLSEDRRRRHTDYLRACQNPDGGFSGREGGSDLYYTAFALRGLAVLGALNQEVCQRAGAYLRDNLARQASVVDFYSLLYASFVVQAGGINVMRDSAADWAERVTELLERFRTPDGGYGKTPGSPSGSVYHTFLVGLCYDLLDRPWPVPERVLTFTRSRQREDGGFVEIAPMRRSGTNPTAAAVGILQLLADPLENEREPLIQFFLSVVSPEGGFRGNGRAPLADLLSTFTALWTLDQLGGLSRADLPAARRFAESLEEAGGGFRGGLWDDRADVEYTFYGLGCLGLLAGGQPS